MTLVGGSCFGGSAWGRGGGRERVEARPVRSIIFQQRGVKDKSRWNKKEKNSRLCLEIIPAEQEGDLMHFVRF